MTDLMIQGCLADIPRSEHPRPQWVRENWMCLNGTWDFAFDFGKSGKARGMVENGDYPLQILVPFCPESKLSGIGYTDFIPAVWYRRTMTLAELPDGRALLHFGAVDFDCTVWVNGILCGNHKGGYTAFEMDITHALQQGENTIVVYAVDDQLSMRQARGKQCDSYRSGGCSYTRTTGIYQTVWLELVPDRYLARAQMTPHGADGALDVCVFAEHALQGDRVRLTAMYHGKTVGSCVSHITGKIANARLAVDDIHLWNAGAPELYDLKIELIDGADQTVDSVCSYFALRDVALNDRALTINGKPVFMRMLLDQGFYPDGVYTAPADADLKRDIELSMELGFNGARFHFRVFDDRSLYWADRLGYLVWGEHAIRDVGGPQGFCDFLPEWMETVAQYYNHPCVIGWICANETYHNMVLDEQVVRMLYRVTKTLDASRPVIDASGGIHYETDLFDVHDYDQNPASLAESLRPMQEDATAFHSPIPRYRGKAPIREETYCGQPYWISECGGTFWAAANKPKNGWGYGDTPSNEEAFAKRYEELIAVMASHPRVCGFCYTQLTDVEQEQNGLYCYDRSPKFSPATYARIRMANEQQAAVEKEQEA